ncbi:uncharacterized protein LOC127790351 [Diospyros lotus]|uniref:uncharacterized protein LOC127790351 n=1 Tax=Diospyros lotus TaxID=55363 RepID=UPI002250F445|nr:uncharacterized protein LOC127790351 [Diospyros lotus]
MFGLKFGLDWIADLSELSFPGLHVSVGIAVPFRICNCLDCSHSRMHGDVHLLRMIGKGNLLGGLYVLDGHSLRLGSQDIDKTCTSVTVVNVISSHVWHNRLLQVKSHGRPRSRIRFPGHLLRLNTVPLPLLLSSGCLGSHTKHKPITSIDEPLRGPKPRGRTVSKSSMLGDFWTTSTCEMDNSAVHSHGSVSSISTVDPHGSSSGNIPSEFVNHGLLLWNQTRQQWIGNKKSDDHAQQLREPKLSWNATYESLLGSSKPFPQPIPLSEMVDFLIDIWEQEGLYD